MTSTDALLAVDAGTSTIKAVAFDPTGATLATASRSVETQHPAPGRAEQDMAAVWDHTTEAIGAVVADLPAAATPVGVGLTGQGDGLWAITDDGSPAGNAILWSDSRAAGILERWEETGQLAALVEQCGSAPYPGMSFPLLAWLAREEPARFDRIDTVLSCKDWLAYRLSGERSIDHSEATVPYLDKTTEAYDRSVFRECDIPSAAGTLPPLTAPTDVVGRVTPEAAAATGLDAGLPVVSGVFDVPAAAIGSGAATGGGGTVTLGTSLTHQILLDGPQDTPGGIQMSLGIDGRWTYAIGSNAGTPSLEWAAGTVAGDTPVSELEPIASEAPPGSNGVLYHPYLSTTGERGPFVDPDARGQFIGLTPETGTESMVRAVYEGLSLAVRDCVEHLPTAPDALTATGGGTQSRFWCQLLSDCLGCPILVPESSEPGAKGAAVLLALATGRYPSLERATDAMVSTDDRYDPRRDMREEYDSLYHLYTTVREEMTPVWDQRAAVYDETFDTG
jgi:xylulokinase